MKKKEKTPLATYDPKRTFLVDKFNYSYLIRGNEPLNPDGSFAYDALNEKLKDLIDKSFDLKKYSLITISIIDNNPEGERSDLTKEFNAYGITTEEFDKMFPFPESWPPVYKKIDVKVEYGKQVNGNPGSIIWYPVQGCPSLGVCLEVEEDQFNFCGLIDYLDSLLNSDNKLVIYYHCEHGHDRTSAVTGAYMLKYMKKSLEDVLTLGPPNGAKAFKHAWEINYEELVKYYDFLLKKKK